MAEQITDLTDTDIRTVWPQAEAAKADDDGTDETAPAGDDDGTDTDDDTSDADEDGTDA
jgi:hypothetical protein